MLCLFGCPAYYHVSDGKLEPRARKVVLLGFKRGVKEYKLWDSEDRRIVLSRDVTFDESSMVKSGQPKEYCSEWRVMHLHHLQIVLYHLGCHTL